MSRRASHATSSPNSAMHTAPRNVVPDTTPQERAVWACAGVSWCIAISVRFGRVLPQGSPWRSSRRPVTAPAIGVASHRRTHTPAAFAAGSYRTVAFLVA